MSRLGQRGRVSWSLSKLITVFFVLLLAAITVALVYLLNHGAKQEITSVGTELTHTLSDTRKLLIRRNLTQIQSNEERAKPLHPIRFETHPSPFTDRDSAKLKKQFPLQTYYAQDDINSIAKILVGYSNVTLSSGEIGSQYLSILAWVSASNLQLYDGTQASRQSYNHLWLVYYDSNGKLQPIFISLQALHSSDFADSPGSRVAEISGFIAPKLGVAFSLRQDSTIKGSVFKAHDGDGYFLSFRMRVKSLLKVPRPRIDVTHPIGLQFILGEIDQQSTISTFTLKDNVTLIDVPHLSGTSIKQALKALPLEIKKIALMVQDTEVASLLTRSYTPYIANGLIESLLWGQLKRLANDNLGVTQTDGDGFLLYLNEHLPQLSTDQKIITLFVNIDPQERLKKLIATQKNLIWLYLTVVLIIIIIILANHFYIVQRIVSLTNALAAFEAGDRKALNSNLQKFNDEIGLLAHFQQRAIQTVEHARLQTEERYKRRAELMAIMGHDIRTPVAALLTLHQDDQETLRYVKKIERASTTILDVAKLDNDFLEENLLESNNACEFFKAVADELRKNFNGTVNFESPEQPVFIYTNNEVLEDAIDGIINNAIDYSQTITIRVSSNSNFGVVEISNDGEPINESIKDSLFDYGVSYRTNQKNQHHGIGLFSVAFRIRILNGEIKALNQQKGVNFVLHLPLASI